MSEPLHEVAEEAKSLEREAEEGKSPRTPLIALSGVTLIVGVIVAFVLVLAFLAYYLS
jgi:hypothetical protein